MSIELSKVKEEKKSGSFSISVAMPNLSNKSNTIKIDSNPMEKKKEEKMEKKKPEPKFYYEYLEEAALKKIRPSSHRPDEHKPEYDCPIAMVCELLGEKFEVSWDEVKFCGGCTGSSHHEILIDRLRLKNVKFLDTYMSYCPVCDGQPYGHSGGERFNELMLSIHISQYHHQGPFNTAQMLKEYLYGEKSKKMKPLPREEPPMRISSEPSNLSFTIRGVDMGESLRSLTDLGESVRIQSMDAEIEPGTNRIITKYTAYVRKPDGSLELREFHDR